MLAAWLKSIPVLGATALAAAAVEMPPVDPSSIDQLLQDLGGQVPFPPEAAYAALEKKGYRVLGAAVFPHGRNFERQHTDYCQPRSEFAVNPGPFNPKTGVPVDPSRTVFLAYTPKTGELQLIGAATTKPFDFRTADHYQAGSPTVHPTAVTRPGLCLSCHQNGGAILPEAPWEEANFTFNTANRKRMRE